MLNQRSSENQHQYYYSNAENYRLLVDSVKDYGIFMLDPQGNIKTWNEGAKNIKGYYRNEIIGKHFSVFYPEEDIKAGKPEFELKEAAREGRFEDEGWRLRKGGTKFWANVVITALFKEGKLMGFAKVTRDLTERKKLENELIYARNALSKTLEETKERLTVALKAAHMGIFDWDVPKDRVFWSDTLLELWNYNRKTFPGTIQGIKQRMHPDDIGRYEQATKNTFEKGEDYDLEYRVIWPDKSIHWINGRGKAIRDNNGEVVRFTGTGTDITDRKISDERNKLLAQASMTLSSSLNYIQTVKSASALTVPSFTSWIIINLIINNEMNRFYVYHCDPTKIDLAKELQNMKYDSNARGGVSKAFKEMKTILVPSITHELSSSEKIEFLSTEDPKQIEIISKLGIASYISTILEVRGKRIGGITFIADQQRAPFVESDKIFAENFSQRIALAIDAGMLYNSAQDAIRVREEVVAIVSHDLKNPLNGVLLNASLLLRTISNEEKNSSIINKVQRIIRSADRMRSMIEDILDVTKLEAGTFTIETHFEDVHSFVMEAIELHKSLAEEKLINLEFSIENNCAKIRCDHQRILQVLSNLLGNAIKFTPVGKSITLNVERAGHDVQFTISDSGPGMSSDELSHIFERYWQVRATQKMGAGLGLFIAKNIVEAHKGRIWAESQEGAGAKFIFTIPRY